MNEGGNGPAAILQLAEMTAAFSVNATGGYLGFYPRFKVANCDLEQMGLTLE
jgi:hypothetical protein